MKLPGSKGEHRLQKELDTTKKALAFYNKQMLDHLNPTMCEFLADQEIVFIATSDAKGECDCSFRTGPPGWVRVINEKTLAYHKMMETNTNKISLSSNKNKTGDKGAAFMEEKSDEEIDIDDI